MTNRVLLAVLLLFCLCLAGCFGPPGDYPDLGQVSGTVTVDGAPAANVTVRFAPKAGGRMSTGVTDSSGKYELAYSAEAMGAVVGMHTVNVTDDAAPSDDQLDLSGSGAIPEKYRDKTFEFEVKEGSNTFDIKLE